MGQHAPKPRKFVKARKQKQDGASKQGGMVSSSVQQILLDNHLAEREVVNKRKVWDMDVQLTECDEDLKRACVGADTVTGNADNSVAGAGFDQSREQQRKP